MVVNGGPRPISIWTGPHQGRNRFQQGRTSQGPGGRLPPMSGMPGSTMGPGPRGSFSFPPGLPGRQGPGQSGASLVKVGNNEQHYFQGLSADYLKEVSNLTGITFITTLYSDNRLRAAFRALDNGEADLLPTVMSDITIPTSSQFSAPYFQTPVLVIMRADAAPLHDISSLKTMKVAGLMSIPLKLLVMGWNSRIQLTSPPDGLRGVATGRFDAFLGERAIIANEFRIASVHNIKVVGELPDPSTFCIAVSPRMAEFISIFDKAVAAIPQEKKQEIQKKWLGRMPELASISNKEATTVPKEKPEAQQKKSSNGKAEFTSNIEKKVAAIPKVKKGGLQQSSSGKEIKKKEPLPKELWPMGFAGAAILLLGGLWLFSYRKRLQGIRNGIAALEPHLLCVHIDQNIKITGVTEALCKATGFSEEDLMGKSLQILGAPPVGGKARLAKLLDAVANGQTWRGEAKLSRKDGSEIWTDVIISPSRRKNDTVGYSIIYQDASERKHFEKLAIRDELTGLYNRRHFNSLAPELLKKAATDNLFIGLFLFDVDNFKKYNDTYGHPAGDDVLAAIGKTLKGLLKRDDDLCFRLGGEEFGMIVPFANQEDAVAVVRKILASIRGLNIEHRHNTPGIVTVSIGVALARGTDGANIDEIYKRADTCLYEAKQTGKNRCVMARAKGQGNAEVKDDNG